MNKFEKVKNNKNRPKCSKNSSSLKLNFGKALLRQFKKVDDFPIILCCSIWRIRSRIPHYSEEQVRGSGSASNSFCITTTDNRNIVTGSQCFGSGIFIPYLILYPGSEFFLPGSRIQGEKDSGLGSATNN